MVVPESVEEEVRFGELARGVGDPGRSEDLTAGLGEEWR